MKIVFQLLVALCLLNNAAAQVDIPVNLYTGTPGLTVSLGTIGGHGIADNIYLFYGTEGVAQNAPKGSYGIGWNLHAAGSIAREVRGLPDDFQGGGSDTRRGWL